MTVNFRQNTKLLQIDHLDTGVIDLASPTSTPQVGRAYPEVYYLKNLNWTKSDTSTLRIETSETGLAGSFLPIINTITAGAANSCGMIPVTLRSARYIQFVFGGTSISASVSCIADADPARY